MKDFDFEKSLKELENTVSLLERGDMSLDESIKTYQKCIGLSKECSEYLNDAKQKIISLSEAESGEKDD